MQSVIKFAMIAAVARLALSSPLDASMLDPKLLSPGTLDPTMLQNPMMLNPAMFQQQLTNLFACSDWQQKAQDVAMKFVENASAMPSVLEQIEGKRSEIQNLISSGAGQDKVKGVMEQMHNMMQG